MKTVTGNPIVISDGNGENAKALSVSFMPRQNLNGYDHPWADETTKNLVGTGNLTWGKSINGSGVIVDYYENRCVTVNPIMIDNTKSYVFSTGASDIRLIYAVFNGSTLVRRTAGTAGTPINVASGDRVFLCFYSYNASGASGQQYDYRKVEPESDEIQFEQASTPTAYIPYGNNCPIDGFSALTVTRTNKNLCPSFSGSESSSSNGITYTYGNDGSITASGTATATSYSRNVRFDLKAGRYRKPQGIVVQEVVSSTYWTVIASDTATEFTIERDIHALVRLRFSSGTTVNNETFYPYIYPYSVTDLSYEEQVTDDFSVSLPTGVDAVYSGSLNVNTGVLTVDKIKIPVSDASMLPEGSNGWKTGTNANRIGFAIDTALLPRQNDSLDILCNIGYASANANINNAFEVGACSLYKGNACMYFRYCVPTSITSVDDAYTFLKNNNCEFTVPLDTPQVYQLTVQQVALLIGINILTTNGDSIELTYGDEAPDLPIDLDAEVLYLLACLSGDATFDKTNIPNSRVGKILYAYLNKSSCNIVPRSRTEHLFRVWCKFDSSSTISEYEDDILSRAEQIIWSKIFKTTYTESPRSIVEELLLNISI